MNEGPLTAIEATFGCLGFPDSLFYQSPISLRFDLGGDLEMGVLRFLQALDRATSVAGKLFEQTATLTAVVSYYGVEKQTRRDLLAFQSLRKIGFDFKFSNPDKIPQRDANHIEAFGEDIYRYWYSADFPAKNSTITPLLWASIAREMPISPKARCMERIYIVDFDRRTALLAYDDRGMDVIATDAALLQPIYNQFGAWLMDYDRLTMDARFGRAC